MATRIVTDKLLIKADRRSEQSIDDTWSAMRFRALKDGEAPFTGGGR